MHVCGPARRAPVDHASRPRVGNLLMKGGLHDRGNPCIGYKKGASSAPRLSNDLLGSHEGCRAPHTRLTLICALAGVLASLGATNKIEPTAEPQPSTVHTGTLQMSCILHSLLFASILFVTNAAIAAKERSALYSLLGVPDMQGATGVRRSEDRQRLLLLALHRSRCDHPNMVSLPITRAPKFGPDLQDREGGEWERQESTMRS